MSVLEPSVAIVITILCLVGKHEAANDNIKIDGSIASALCQPPWLEWFSRMVKCTNERVLLRSGYCATFEEGRGIFIAKCPYFLLNGHNVTEPGYIRLPDNISELNDYMCGPMNRKGLLCKDCIDGFGPSVTSLGYKCSNCTDVWYGIPLYLAVELIPITLFYLIILIFKVHLISAPMPLIILCCHLIMYMLLFERHEPIERLLPLDSSSPLLAGVISFLGIWNLDFIRYIAPPFCVSSRLLPSHIEILDYITNFYPLFLIIFTVICIDLHDRNFRPFVWIWRPLHKYFARFQRKWDIRNDIIDVFASFFLLFYIKLGYLGSILYKCFAVRSTPKGPIHACLTIDGCFSRSRPKYAYTVIPFVLVFNVLPVLLLVLYPFKLFRKCLSKCKLDKLFISTFVEKFHGCYRDGLDGGKDMRSFCGLYFFLVILMSQVHHHFLKLKLHISPWLSSAFIFLTFSLLIALIQPYKKKHINILDSLLLAHLAVIYVLFSRDYFPGDGVQMFAMILLPATMFGIFAVFKIISKYLPLLRVCRYCCERCKQLFKYTKANTIHDQSRQLVNPMAFFEDSRKYGTFSEVSIQ
jgi:hypothetical protein